MSAAGCEVRPRAAGYIGHLRHAEIRCSPASYILRSVNRDLVDETRLVATIRDQLAPAPAVAKETGTGLARAYRAPRPGLRPPAR
ncbi:MAG: hypothetical protein ACRD0R_20040 [Acidimicrobiales bacterium]